MNLGISRSRHFEFIHCYSHSNSQMINLYSDPDGKRIFDKNNSVTGWEMATLKHHPTSSAGSTHIQSGSDGEKTISETEEALKEKDRRISELEKELSIIKVKRQIKTSSISYHDDRKALPGNFG